MPRGAVASIALYKWVLPVSLLEVSNESAGTKRAEMSRSPPGKVALARASLNLWVNEPDRRQDPGRAHRKAIDK
jgi:hypothetical protein